ncbi:CapA family protein [Candidatus Nomurabacteria bacterium]|nr:CapA family protein [Candidatus Nomurabacteria bacterium]
MPYKHIGKRYIALLLLTLVAIVVAAFGLAYRAYSMQAQQHVSDFFLGIQPLQNEAANRVIHLDAHLEKPELYPYIGDIRTILYFQTARVDHVVTTDKNIQIGGDILKVHKGSIRDISRGDAKLAMVDNEQFSQNIHLQRLATILENFKDAQIIPFLVPEEIEVGFYQDMMSALSKEIDEETLVSFDAQYGQSSDVHVEVFQKQATDSLLASARFDQIETIHSPNKDVLAYFFENGAGSTYPALIYVGGGAGHLYTADNIRAKGFSSLNFGDMMLDRSVAKVIEAKGEDALFAPLMEASLLEGVNEIAANLEGPFADQRRPTSKSIAFRFDPVLIPMLARHHFSLFTLANNHTTDMGAAGDSESRVNLGKYGIAYYGHQLKDSIEDSLIIREYGNTKVAYIGFDDTIIKTDTDIAAGIIEEAKKRADYVIISIHWGEEYKLISNLRQRNLAHAFVDAGADVVIGHHPHVVEEVEVYNGKPIFYSLGNFVFDQYFSTDTQQGLAVGLIASGDGLLVHLFPLQGKESVVSLMDDPARELFLQALNERSRLPEDESLIDGVLAL